MPREHTPPAKGFSNLAQHITETLEEAFSPNTVLQCPEGPKRFAKLPSGPIETDTVQDRDFDLCLKDAGSREFVRISVTDDDLWFNPRDDGDGAIPFLRKDPNEGTGIDDARPKQNQTAAVIDAGAVYGADTATVAALRGEAGYLLLEDGLLVDINHGVSAGDVGANEKVALISERIRFAREHNRLVDELSAQNPDWSSDDLYYAARIRVEAQLRIIAPKKLRHKLANNGTNSNFGGYDETVTPVVPLKLSTAAIRQGHSPLPCSIECIEEDGPDVAAGVLPQRAAPCDTSEIANIGGINLIRRWLANGMTTT